MKYKQSRKNPSKFRLRPNLVGDGQGSVIDQRLVVNKAM
jgi:hypothetical protein